MLWLVLISLICVFGYLKIIRPLAYWRDKGIAYQKPWPLVGNMASIVFRRKAFIDVVRDFYNAFPNERYSGMYQFTKPMLVVRDLDLIKQITITHFDHFVDHNSFVSDDVDPLMGKNLFSLKGQSWRDMRTTLSPSFTSSKMRGMFVLLSECADQFTKYFEKQGCDTIEVEMKDMFTRFTNDAIASIAFGLKVDSLDERENEFFMMGKAATNFTALRTLKLFVSSSTPKLSKWLGIKMFRYGSVRLALLENKTLCFHLLSKFNIVPIKRTPIPLVIAVKGLNMMPEGGFWLGLHRRKVA